ncbi:lipopolysaccharide biosynthesis protein [Sphingobium sp.]|uniref:lipopolysaccharide biosynthesis protein n=1 Tax=Sphingobium sp. TaxID=1912891 RepID=UPI003BB59247
MLIRHTLLYLPAQVLAPAIALVTILVWAYLLPTSDVGMATLVVAAQEISYTIFYLWWSHFALRHLPRFRREGVHHFLQTETPAIALAVLVQIAVFAPLAFFYFPGIGVGTVLSITIYVVTRSLLRYFAERARSDTCIGLYTLIQVGGPAIGLALNFLLVPIYGAHASVVLAGFSIGQAIVVLIGIIKSDFGREAIRPRRAILREATSFGGPIALANSQAMIALNAPRFIVDWTLGLAAAGQFAVSYGLGMRAASFATMLVTAGAFPLVVKRMETEGLAAAYAQLRQNILLVATVLLPVGFGLFALTHSTVDTILPPQFRETAYWVLPLATIGGMLRSMRFDTTDQVFQIRSRTLFISFLGACDLVICCILAWVGAMQFGATGAVLGPLFAAIVSFIASQLLARLVLDFSFPTGDVLRVTLAAAVMAGFVSLVPNTHKLPILIGIVIGGAIIYIVALAAFLPAGYRQQVFRMMGKFRRSSKPVGD